MKDQDAQSLQVFMQRVFEQNNLTDASDGVQVMNAYKQVVGDLISKLSRKIRYEKHTLYVQLSSAALCNELSYKRQGLIDAINKKIGRDVLTNIFFS